MIDCEQMWSIFPKTTQWNWSRLILTKAVSETRDVVTYEGLGLVLLQHTNLISLHWGFLKWGTQAIIQVIGHVSTRGNQKKWKRIPRFWETSIVHEENTIVGHTFFWTQREQMLTVQPLLRGMSSITTGIYRVRQVRWQVMLGTLAGSGPDSPKISQNEGFLKWGQP
jgi:hypothetical protein